MSTKQHTAEFEKCINQVMEQGHDKGSAFGICTKSFQDAGKPVFVGESETQKLHLFCESFKLEGNKVSGVAIHPKRIFHPEEDMTHVYLREELEKAAPTGAGKPFGIDHIYVLPPPNLLTKSWYCPEEDGICFEGLVDDYIAEQIRQKKFKGISIELNWLRPGGSVEYVNGVAARNFELTSVHFLKQFPPGDPDAYVKLWEQIKEQLVVGPPLPLDQRVEALEQQLQELLNQLNVINARLDTLQQATLGGVRAQPQIPPSPIGLKNPSKTRGDKMSKKMKEGFKEKLKKYPGYTQKKYLRLLEAKIPLNRLAKLLEAEWDTEYINDLPDSAFAVIAPGGEKDEQGKTVPRDLRKLPHHNMQDNLDLDHLRAALARLNQIEPADLQAKAKKHLCGHARGEKAEDLVSKFCGEEPPAAESLKAKKALMKKLREQGDIEDIDECVRAGLEVDMLANQIADMCGVSVQYVLDFTEAKKLMEQLITPEKRDCVEQGIAAGLSKDEIAQECEVSLADLELFEALREQQDNQEPEKDEHGCVVGKERWDAENEKCVPIETVKEQQGETDERKQFMAQCLESGKSMEECAAEWKQKQQAQTESLVTLRRKLVEVEAQLVKMEKQQKRKAATWKEKFEKLRESVKGAIPPPRIWKSWTPGPQRYVQENLKILREIES